MIEESVNSEIAQKELKDAIYDLAMKILIEESSHAEEFFVEALQDMDISSRNVVSHKDEELINFDIASKIKQQEDILGKDDFQCASAINKIFGILADLKATPKF